MHDYTVANTISDIFRTIFSIIDKGAYMLLGWMYQILFNVASADIFANDTIQKFYGRVQLIIGVFMLFKVAISIIQGIINPDTFTDKKSGFSNVITRIIFAIAMLTVLTPINIPSPANSYQVELNNNGLLFGTLYSLQTRILENNTLGRLILGTTDNNTLASGDPNMTESERLTKASNIFTSTILKGFIRFNLKDGETDETKAENRVCSNISQDVIKVYTSLETDPNQLLSLVNASCQTQKTGFAAIIGAFKRLGGSDRYVFAYIPVISTIVAAIFVYILLGEIVTIAIRTVKLAVLRLIAPIPIISYIDPKSAKDGAFASWVKSLASTYLELFIHLAVIYFVIFLIQDMIVNGIVINTGSGIIGVLSFIFIWIGLFFFIKQAPKFIKDVLGIKGGGTNVGLAGLLGGTAMLAGGGGLRGFALGAMSGTDAAIQGYNQGKAAPIGAIWKSNQDAIAKIKTGDKDARGGLAGNMLNRLDYSTRERRARLLGISNKDLADAKFLSDTREAQAAATKEELDLATQALNSLPPTATEAERAAARARYEAAYRKNAAYQTAAAKAAKAYDKMDKDRAQMGVAPRVIDKRIDKSFTSRLVHKINGDEEGKYIPEGTYRSPFKTTNDPQANWDYASLPDDPKGAGNKDEDIMGTIEGHTRDLKNFNGTTDDRYPWGGGGPRGGGPGGPRP